MVNEPSQNLDQTVYHRLASFSTYFFIEPSPLPPASVRWSYSVFLWPESVTLFLEEFGAKGVIPSQITGHPLYEHGQRLPRR
jgi:hypothetical protein